MTSNNTDQPRVPGVRYRRVTRQRMVETTIGGETRLTPQTYEDWEPVPPRNLDVIGLRCVVGLAVLMTAVSVVWSTTSIGDQLSAVVFSGIAYGAASLFELTWIGLMVVEWLLRYDPGRARLARGGGFVALLVVVGSVVTHGVDKEQVAAGVIGGGVSILAKGLWVVVMRMFHVPLGEGAASFLQQKREELAVDRVVLGEQQRLDGMQAYLSAIYGEQAVQALKTARPARAQELPVAPAAATPELPAVTTPIPAQPALQPVPAPAVPAPSVASVAAPAVPAPAAATVPASPASAPQPPTTPAPPIRQISVPSIASICDAEISANRAVTNAELLAAVLAAGHVDRPSLADTVRRTALRIDSTRKAS